MLSNTTFEGTVPGERIKKEINTLCGNGAGLAVCVCAEDLSLSSCHNQSAPFRSLLTPAVSLAAFVWIAGLKKCSKALCVMETMLRCYHFAERALPGAESKSQYLVKRQSVTKLDHCSGCTSLARSRARVTTSCQRPASANAFAATRGALREVLPQTRHLSSHLVRSTTGSSRSDERGPAVSSCDIQRSRGPWNMARKELKP